MRINHILRDNAQMTVDDMRKMHTDPKSELTPFVMAAIASAAESAKTAGVWTADDSVAYSLLTAWDSEFVPDSRGAVLFTMVTTQIGTLLWDELILPGETRRVVTPQQAVLVSLLRENASVWWDLRSTADSVETRDEIVLLGMRKGWALARSLEGNDPATWRWGKIRMTNINHILRLPGFGRDSLEVRSGPGTLSPSDNGGTHGASWRFVVELAPEIRAWGTYPGGQSGNPVSRRYDDRIDLWQAGELAELRVPGTAADLSVEHTTARLVFTGKGGAR